MRLCSVAINVQTKGAFGSRAGTALTGATQMGKQSIGVGGDGDKLRHVKVDCLWIHGKQVES